LCSSAATGGGWPTPARAGTLISELVTVVILSAVVATLIAQTLLQPSVNDTEQQQALAAENVSVLHRRPRRL
jgi:hypothetical protein